MNNLQIIENQNQRVLLTSQLAEVYETDDKVISYNFNHNKERYTEGKHFYCLTGDELKEFFATVNFTNANTGKIRSLYLWTEKGAMLHAKSLNTDKAWEVYETLVDTYFEVKQAKPMSQIEILAMQANILVEMDKKVNAIEQKADKTTAKLENALDVFVKPNESGWKENTNRILNQICVENNLHYQTFKHDLYTELEQMAKCGLAARQRNLKTRLKTGGAKYTECQAISKLDVVARDDKLRLIFDGIVKRYQAKYLR